MEDAIRSKQRARKYPTQDIKRSTLYPYSLLPGGSSEVIQDGIRMTVKMGRQRTINEGTEPICFDGSTPLRWAFPARTFEDALARLTMVLQECRTDLTVDPVRSLRKALKRMEAQIKFLDLLQDKITIPRHSLNKLQKSVKRIRQATGKVRDLDVQGELVVRGLSQQPGDSSEQIPQTPPARAIHLNKHLTKQRKKEASKLLQVLNRERRRLRQCMSAANGTMQAFNPISFTVEDLQTRIGEWLNITLRELYKPQGASATSLLKAVEKKIKLRVNVPMTKKLHEVRKLAKIGRYIIETACPKGLWSSRLIAELKTLQRVGGQWHDWLLVQRIAAKHYGRRSKLAKHYAQNQDAALTEYITTIAGLSLFSSTAH